MAITKQKSTLASAYGLPPSGQTFSGSGGTPMAKPPRPTYAGTTGTGQAYANSGLPYQGSGGGAGMPMSGGTLGIGGGPGLLNPGVQTRLDEYGRIQYLDAMSGQWYYPSPQQQAQSGTYTNEYGQFNGDGTVGMVAGDIVTGPASDTIQGNAGNVGSVVVGTPEWWAAQQPAQPAPAPPPPPPPPTPEPPPAASKPGTGAGTTPPIIQQPPPGYTWGPGSTPANPVWVPLDKSDEPSGQNPLRPGENPMLRAAYGIVAEPPPPKQEADKPGGTGQDGTTYGGGAKPVDANSGNTTADYPRPPGPIQRPMGGQAGNTSGITYGEHDYPGGPGQKQQAPPSPVGNQNWDQSYGGRPVGGGGAGSPPMPGPVAQPPVMQLPPAWGTDPAYADYIAYQHQLQWANDPEYQRFQQWKQQYYKPQQPAVPNMGTTLNGQSGQTTTTPAPEQPSSWLPSTGANGQPLPRRLAMMQDYGMKLPQTTVQASTGQTLTPYAGGQQFTGLGGGTLPSGQTLNNMDPSERSVYQGYVEGPVGMPWSSAVQAITQPTQHLQAAKPAQRQV